MADKKEGVFEAMRKSTEGIKKTFANISKISSAIIIPKIDFTKLIEPIKIRNIKSPKIIIEENNWERHSELLKVHEASLNTQEAILKEQKSTSRLTKWILILTIILLIITGFSIWLQIR